MAVKRERVLSYVMWRHAFWQRQTFRKKLLPLSSSLAAIHTVTTAATSSSETSMNLYQAIRVTSQKTIESRWLRNSSNRNVSLRTYFGHISTCVPVRNSKMRVSRCGNYGQKSPGIRHCLVWQQCPDVSEKRAVSHQGRHGSSGFLWNVSTHVLECKVSYPWKQ